LLTALLSDIHGNLEALNACLSHARDRGAERYVFLGDLVGYGADAGGVVEVVVRYAARGAVVLKGNHDEAVEESGGYFNDAARAAIEWARETLTQDQRRFLATLPLVVRQGEACYVHASAAAPERWGYVDSP
jgi:predicted phosphodiesterase